MRSEWERKARDIRRRTLDMVYHSQAPHIGSALSCVEILTSLYGVSDLEKIRLQSKDRNRIILSKGHAIAAQLSALCEYGLLEEEVVMQFCKNRSLYPENTSPYTPYIEMGSGSLGQGLSYGVGIALGMNLRGCRESRAYVVAGDGELNEGQCWEAILQAGRMRLKCLTVLVDVNKLAGIGDTCANMDMEAAFASFGFQALSVDGHDIVALLESLRIECDRPIAILCHTVKGKGVSFMENNNDWHYRPISRDDYERIGNELAP